MPQDPVRRLPGEGVVPKERDGIGFWDQILRHMADNRPLSENETDNRLKAALNALGEAPGVTVAADAALTAAPQGAFAYFIGPHSGRR